MAAGFLEPAAAPAPYFAPENGAEIGFQPSTRPQPGRTPELDTLKCVGQDRILSV